MSNEQQDEGRIDPFDISPDTQFDPSCLTGDERAFDSLDDNPPAMPEPPARAWRNAHDVELTLDDTVRVEGSDIELEIYKFDKDCSIGLTVCTSDYTWRTQDELEVLRPVEDPAAEDPVFGGMPVEAPGCGVGIPMCERDFPGEGIDEIVNDSMGSREVRGKPKLRLDLVPPEIAEFFAGVAGFGAEKYDDWNWLKGLNQSETYGCAMRHLAKWYKGEDLDDESGMSHLWHALWNVGVMAYFERHRPDLDNRALKPAPTIERGYRIEVSLPVSDADGDIYEFAETDLNLEIRDEAHAMALHEDLSEGMYAGRWVNLFLDDELVIGSRVPRKTQDPVAGGSSGD